MLKKQSVLGDMKGTGGSVSNMAGLGGGWQPLTCQFPTMTEPEFYLVLKNTPKSRCLFSVKAPLSTSVSEFKKLVLREKLDWFQELDVDEFVPWKVPLIYSLHLLMP